MRVTKVLIVDDSALMRKMLASILDRDPELEVVGTAGDPYIARDKIRQLNPDVLTLDIEMPRMDGLTFLRNLMRLRPMPVVMVSTLTERGADVTMQALEIGAVDFVTKPRADSAAELEAQAHDLVMKVKAAARARLRGAAARPSRSAAAIIPTAEKQAPVEGTALVAIGASTGGTEAIKDVLVPIDGPAPIFVVAQHIPAGFSASFAKRLDSLCRLEVCEATDGQRLEPGHVYIAPGSAHLFVERDGMVYTGRLSHGPEVNRHRPSVDVLFRSVARNIGRRAVGVLLTGMGADGAAGLLEMREAGSPTLAQDEATSVVWGMPGEAIKRGAAGEVLPLDRISARMLELAGCLPAVASVPSTSARSGR